MNEEEEKMVRKIDEGRILDNQGYFYSLSRQHIYGKSVFFQFMGL